MHALLSAAKTMLPAPMPSDEQQRLVQLNNEAFVASFILSNMIEATRPRAYAEHDEFKTKYTDAQTLLNRLYRVSRKMHARFSRRNARLVAWQAVNLPHPIVAAADASAEKVGNKL